MKRKIAIVGAGMGGLTLANALQDLSDRFEVHVYERDPDVNSRTQGYSLSYNHHGGIKAFQRFGLYDKLKMHGRPGTGLTFCLSTGEVLLAFQPSKESHPEYRHSLSRLLVRNALLDRLKSVSVHWSSRVSGYEQKGDRVLLRFEDREPVEVDLVVAADGVNSRIREQMIGDQPRYVGVTAIHGLLECKVEHPLIGRGAFMMLAPGKSMFFQKYGDQGEATWSFSQKIERDAFKGKSGNELKAIALRETQEWASPARELIEQTLDEKIGTRHYYDRKPLRNARDGNVILIGDAAHPMTPHRGQGANMAMRDALELADRLSGNPSMDEALEGFNTEMLKRSNRFVTASHDGTQELHATNSIAIAIRNRKFRLFNWMLSKIPQQRS